MACANSFIGFWLKKLIYVISLLISSVPLRVLCQDKVILAQGALAEKIYLQLDGSVYTTGETIWFKAILTDAAFHFPTPLSGVLHVELIGSNEQLLDQKLIKIENGTGEGYFDLPADFPVGICLIRAYTRWNKNFEEGFIFKEYINVFPASADYRAQPIDNFALVEKQPGKKWLQARFRPQLIDSSHQKKLTVYLNLDDRKDSVLIKGTSGNNYLLDYELPETPGFVTLHMQTDNEAVYSKTLALNKQVALQFFPESGEMVHGLLNKVGFKALGPDGGGVPVEGTIVDQKGDTITSFQSNHLGMGSFFLLADSASAYHAALTISADSTEADQLPVYPLPAVAGKGNVLSVTPTAGTIRLVAASNYMKSDSIGIQVSCRGVAYYLIKGRLKEGHLVFSLPEEDLPEGIIVFTMLDDSGQAVAERLCFNMRQEKPLQINISTGKPVYNPREKTAVDIQITDSSGQVNNANLSLLVVNKALMGQLQASRQNIVSYFLLGSELQGEIEDPGHYFRENSKDRLQDLDALLLTQGWRKYNYKLPVRTDSVFFEPERELVVSGTVGGVISRKKKKEGVELTMMTFGSSPGIQAQTTDSLGRFRFPLYEAYGQDLNILIQSADKSSKNKNYSITLDTDLPPKVQYDHQKSVEEADSVVHFLVEKQRERQSAEEAYRLASGTTLLDEVVVEDYRITPERKKVIDTYGEPDEIIAGDAIRDKEEKWSYGLYSVLLFNYPDKVRIKRVGGAGGYLHAEVAGSEETLVVIDGIPVAGHSYNLIPNIPPGEVRSVEIVEFAKNFSSLFMEVFPEASPMSIPMTGSVIAIYTHAGNGLYDARSPVGLLRTSIPVFSPPREFYVPRYEPSHTEDAAKPDLRALIYWAPQLITDSAGRAETTFYNADIDGEMLIVVEAITPNGEIGYTEKVYGVNKKAAPQTQ